MGYSSHNRTVGRRVANAPSMLVPGLPPNRKLLLGYCQFGNDSTETPIHVDSPLTLTIE